MFGVFVWKRDSIRKSWGSLDYDPEPVDCFESKSEAVEFAKKLKTHDGLTRVIVKRG